MKLVFTSKLSSTILPRDLFKSVAIRFVFAFLIHIKVQRPVVIAMLLIAIELIGTTTVSVSYSHHGLRTFLK